VDRLDEEDERSAATPKSQRRIRVGEAVSNMLAAVTFQHQHETGLQRSPLMSRWITAFLWRKARATSTSRMIKQMWDSLRGCARLYSGSQSAPARRFVEPTRSVSPVIAPATFHPYAPTHRLGSSSFPHSLPSSLES
jgi:hypothetical protein